MTHSLQPTAAARRKYRMKRSVAGISLAAFGAAFELASRHVPAMREEIASWDMGRRVTIGILPNGPKITIENRGDRIANLGGGDYDPALSILFKNIDSALLVFLGRIGADGAVAENRITVWGNNAHAMQATRAMQIVQAYLFPDFILKHTFKRPPHYTFAQRLAKLRIMGELAPVMIMASLRSDNQPNGDDHE